MKNKPIKAEDFRLSRFADSAADAVDAYSARAAELRVSGLNPTEVRLALRKEMFASFVCFLNQGNTEVMAIDSIVQMLCESICRVSEVDQ